MLQKWEYKAETFKQLNDVLDFINALEHWRKKYTSVFAHGENFVIVFPANKKPKGEKSGKQN